MGGYAPGAESPFQIGDRHPRRVSLLTPLQRRGCVASSNVRVLTNTIQKEVMSYEVIELGRRRIIQKRGTTYIEAALKSFRKEDLS